MDFGLTVMVEPMGFVIQLLNVVEQRERKAKNKSKEENTSNLDGKAYVNNRFGGKDQFSFGLSVCNINSIFSCTY